MIAVPDLVLDGTLACIVSMSGGKDSTACALALREAGVPFSMVFADTGWEAPETYAHLDHLRETIGPIATAGVEGGMVAKIHHRAGFPSRMQRWCTRELKLIPLRAYHDAIEEIGGAETVNVVGIRADESKSRARMCAWEDDETWGGWMWRPILTWTIAEAVEIHVRNGVRMNPLYHRGHNRVGCYPCIYAAKEEIRLVADHAPGRIDEIRALEAAAMAERQARNVEKPGRYKHAVGTYFQGRDSRGGIAPIDEVVEWSRTSHGGRQLPLLPPAPEGGCFRWGMCEPPVKDGA